MGMVVIQPYISVSKLKKIRTKFLRCTGNLNAIKTLQSKICCLQFVIVVFPDHTHLLFFMANSSSCTTTELSKLLTPCLTAVKNMLLSTVKGI